MSPEQGRPASWWQRGAAPGIQRACASLTQLAGGVAAARRWCYRAGLLRSHRAGAPVVSVGGVALGGSGKTPACRWVAEWLVARGLRVGVVCGGYQGTERARVQAVDPAADRAHGVRRMGDEALLLAGWLPHVQVVCGRDKAEAAELAVERGAQVVVLDDGFQHRRLHRDLDLVLVADPRERALRPLSLELGREPAASLQLADLVWVHRRDGGRPDPRVAAVGSRFRLRRLVDSAGRDRGSVDRLRGRSAYLVAGVADPAAFHRAIERLGAEIRGTSFIRDHGELRSRQIRRAARSGADLVLCTEKDLVRMAGHPLRRHLVAVTGEVEVVHGLEVLERALGRVAGAACCG